VDSNLDTAHRQYRQKNGAIELDKITADDGAFTIIALELLLPDYVAGNRRNLRRAKGI
jgi:hypothetical protein